MSCTRRGTLSASPTQRVEVEPRLVPGGLESSAIDGRERDTEVVALLQPRAAGRHHLFTHVSDQFEAQRVEREDAAKIGNDDVRRFRQLERPDVASEGGQSIVHAVDLREERHDVDRFEQIYGINLACPQSSRDGGEEARPGAQVEHDAVRSNGCLEGGDVRVTPPAVAQHVAEVDHVIGHDGSREARTALRRTAAREAPLPSGPL